MTISFLYPVQLQSLSKNDDNEEFHSYMNEFPSKKGWNYLDETSLNFINKIKRNFPFVPSRGKKLQERFNFQGSRGK
uniref:Uncharacterized protein n=1 Tax=Strongyloides stercoralis TaxID=6248 RepID=A0A0K0EHE8_STRER